MKPKNLIAAGCGALNLVSLLMPWMFASMTTIHVSLIDREFSSPGYEFLTASKALDQLPLIGFLVASVGLIVLTFISASWRRTALIACGIVCIVCALVFRFNIATIDTDALGGTYDVGVSIGYGWYIGLIASALSLLGAVLSGKPARAADAN